MQKHWQFGALLAVVALTGCELILGIEEGKPAPSNPTGSGAGPACVDGAQETCEQALGAKGTCASGHVTCNGGTWGECDIQPAAKDSCDDGNDDDCDGTQNKGCDCINGALKTCAEVFGAQGSCASGIVTCSQGTWGECSIQPTASDTCDASNDDNCNGLPNEPDCACINGTTENCAAALGAQGACASGIVTCNGGMWGMCSIQPTADTCVTGNDNDCDGTANEGCNCTNGATQPCGYCNTGSALCSNGQWGTCTGVTGCAPFTKKSCTPKYQYGCTASQTCSSLSCTWGSCVSTCVSFTPTTSMPGVSFQAFDSYKTGPNCFGSSSNHGPWQVCPTGSHIDMLSCAMDSSTGTCSTTQTSSNSARLTVNSVNDCGKEAWAHLVVKCIAD